MTILTFLIGCMIHPFHLSVSNIYYKPKEKVVQVEQRIFLDDLEEALRDYTKDSSLVLKEDDDHTKTLVSKYILEKFFIESNGKRVNLIYLGHEFVTKENVIWCYFEAEKVKKFESFQVKNSLLVEKFEDQENIIHFTSPEGNKRSERTTLKDNWAEFN